MDERTKAAVEEIRSVARDIEAYSSQRGVDSYEWLRSLAQDLRAAADCLTAMREGPGYGALLSVFHEAQEMMRYRAETSTGNSQEVATTHFNHLIRAVRAVEAEQAHPALTVTSAGPEYGQLLEFWQAWQAVKTVSATFPSGWTAHGIDTRRAAYARFEDARAALAATEG